MAEGKCMGTGGEKSRGMETVLSVAALFVRSSFYKILAVLVLLTLSEGIYFFHFREKEMGYPVEALFTGVIPFLFLTALGAAFFLLARSGGLLGRGGLLSNGELPGSRGLLGNGGRTPEADSSGEKGTSAQTFSGAGGQYTMMRLRITQKRIFIIRTMYNVLCLMLLFAVQVILAFWMIRCYGQAAGQDSEASLHLFLAFYRSEFLHCLLPLAETGKWVRNCLLVLAFGMEAAGEAGRREAAVRIGLFILTFIWFASPVGMGYRDMLCCMVYAVTVAADVVRGGFWRKGGRYEREGLFEN